MCGIRASGVCILMSVLIPGDVAPAMVHSRLPRRRISRALKRTAKRLPCQMFTSILKVARQAHKSQNVL